MVNTIIDLSHILTRDMPVYPESNPPEIKELANIPNNGYHETQVSYSTHTGTHIDGPAHLHPKGKTLDQFPISKFIGEAVCIDCTGETSITYKKLSSDLRKSVKTDFVLLYTGWASSWGKDEYYSGFPLLDDDALEYILDLGLKGIGIDAISFDAIGDPELKIHKKMLSRDMILIENLKNLENITGTSCMFFCPPLLISNLEGSPSRAYAIVNS